MALAPTSKQVFDVGTTNSASTLHLASSRAVVEQLAHERSAQLAKQFYKSGIKERTFSEEGAIADAWAHAAVTSVRDVVRVTGDLLATAVSEGADVAGRKFYDQTAHFVVSIPLQLQELRELLALADRQGEILLIGHAVLYTATPTLLGSTVRAGIVVKRGGKIKSIAIDQLPDGNGAMKSGQVGIVRFDPADRAVGFDPLAAELQYVLDNAAEFPSPKGGMRRGKWDEPLSSGPARSSRPPTAPRPRWGGDGSTSSSSHSGGIGTLEAPTSISTNVNGVNGAKALRPSAKAAKQPPIAPPPQPLVGRPGLSPNSVKPLPIVGLPTDRTSVGEKETPAAPKMPTKEEIDQRRYNAAVPFEWHIFYSKEDWLADGCPTNVDEIRRMISARMGAARGSGGSGGTTTSLATSLNPENRQPATYKGSLSLLEIFQRTTRRYQNASPGDLLLASALRSLQRKLVTTEGVVITIKDPEGDMRFTNISFSFFAGMLRLFGDLTDSAGTTLRSSLRLLQNNRDYNVEIIITPTDQDLEPIEGYIGMSDILVNGEFFVDVAAIPAVVGMTELSLQQQARLSLQNGQNGDLQLDAVLRERGATRLYPHDLESELQIKLRPNQDVVAATVRADFTHTSVADGMSGRDYYHGHWIALQAQRFTHLYFDDFVSPALRMSNDLPAIREAVVRLVRAANNHVVQLFSDPLDDNTRGTTLVGAFTLPDQRVIIYSTADSQVAVVPGNPTQPILYTPLNSAFEQAIIQHGYSRTQMLSVNMIDENYQIPKPVDPNTESRSKEFSGDLVLGPIGNIDFNANDVFVGVVTLQETDSLFLYTDGLPKAVGSLPTDGRKTPLPQELARVHAEDLGKTEYGRLNRLLHFLSEPGVDPATLLLGPAFAGTDVDDLGLVRVRRGPARASQLPSIHTLELSATLADLKKPISSNGPSGDNSQENFDDILVTIVDYLQRDFYADAIAEWTELPVNCQPDIYKQRRNLATNDSNLEAMLAGTAALQRSQLRAAPLTIAELEKHFQNSTRQEAKEWLRQRGVDSFTAFDAFLTREAVRLGIDKQSTTAWQTGMKTTDGIDARMLAGVQSMQTPAIQSPEELQETFDADLEQCLDNLRREEWKEARQRLVKFARRTLAGGILSDREMEKLFAASPHRSAIMNLYGIPTYLGFETFVELNYIRYRTYPDNEIQDYLRQLKDKRSYKSGIALNLTTPTTEAVVYAIDDGKKIAKVFFSETTPATDMVRLNNELRLARHQYEIYIALAKLGVNNLPSHLLLIHLEVDGVDHIALAMDYYEGAFVDEANMSTLTNLAYRNDLATMLAAMQLHGLRIVELQFMATASRLILIDPLDIIIGRQAAARLPADFDQLAPAQSQHDMLARVLSGLTASARARPQISANSPQAAFDQHIAACLTHISSQDWPAANAILQADIRTGTERSWHTDAQMETLFQSSSQRPVILRRFAIKSYVAFEELVKLNFVRHQKFSDSEIQRLLQHFKQNDSHLAGRLLNPPRVEADGTVVAASSSAFVYLIANETQVAKVFHVHPQRGQSRLTETYRLHEEYARANRQLHLYLALERLGLSNLPQNLRIVHLVFDGIDHFALAMTYIDGEFVSESNITNTNAAAATFLKTEHLHDINLLIRFMETHPATIHDLQFIITDARWIVLDPGDLFLGHFPTMVFPFMESPEARRLLGREVDNSQLLKRLKEYRDYLMR